MDDIISTAKSIITEEVARAGYQVVRILLFGSRARGDARPDSDWDFFVITDREPLREEKQTIVATLSLRFAALGFYADVILQAEALVQARKANTGFLAYYVLKEGLPI
ncbi:MULTISPECIES: nucleotidyltransferase domain-containing protein [Chloracidobacterium]|jgi:predicted nucleotidyltransferase|uniref:Nucleotidyltransferase domain-containing protein n=1 Tax=Chloracidobacterium sp. N TaxID=2821540 RepID=A0ABX8B366_9BACT|nr:MULTISPECIES: nucleotidyltransferase domain-containing protein [Chloracidobacterium]QUV83397.1 nucleotidyltransferase domain-containing protein [Chloracidobacterium sp. D]QUV86124.1 nucleotidyltransferase domain-containing protein [Chloracidobacterium sp. 2]QUV89429.1 nucleotidyltransferase domain-containing protein [Chloracidobacterium sp. S]QUV92568.1 nucleotidyltransferase domain-containing protein [Chloracidobacterium sp. A]QUV95042.1 nucleotidyltransferase domain-containing protein [Ch